MRKRHKHFCVFIASLLSTVVAQKRSKALQSGERVRSLHDTSPTLGLDTARTQTTQIALSQATTIGHLSYFRISASFVARAKTLSVCSVATSQNETRW